MKTPTKLMRALRMPKAIAIAVSMETAGDFSAHNIIGREEAA
jgi:hypothetical protein